MTTWATRDVQLLEAARHVLALFDYDFTYVAGTQGIKAFMVKRGTEPWVPWVVRDEVEDGEMVLALIVGNVLGIRLEDK